MLTACSTRYTINSTLSSYQQSSTSGGLANLCWQSVPSWALLPHGLTQADVKVQGVMGVFALMHLSRSYPGTCFHWRDIDIRCRDLHCCLPRLKQWEKVLWLLVAKDHFAPLTCTKLAFSKTLQTSVSFCNIWSPSLNSHFSSKQALEVSFPKSISKSCFCWPRRLQHLPQSLKFQQIKDSWICEQAAQETDFEASLMEMKHQLKQASNLLCDQQWPSGLWGFACCLAASCTPDPLYVRLFVCMHENYSRIGEGGEKIQISFFCVSVNRQTEAQNDEGMLQACQSLMKGTDNWRQQQQQHQHWPACGERLTDSRCIIIQIIRRLSGWFFSFLF